MSIISRINNYDLLKQNFEVQMSCGFMLQKKRKEMNTRYIQ